MVLALADLLSKELGWNVYVHNVGILVGCVFAISLSAYGLEKALWRTNSFLEGASFFVFASHVIVQIFIYRSSGLLQNGRLLGFTSGLLWELF